MEDTETIVDIINTKDSYIYNIQRIINDKYREIFPNTQLGKNDTIMIFNIYKEPKFYECNENKKIMYNGILSISEENFNDDEENKYWKGYEKYSICKILNNLKKNNYVKDDTLILIISENNQYKDIGFLDLCEDNNNNIFFSRIDDLLSYCKN